MLGIDVNVDVKSVQFPIYFDYERNNRCVHCGQVGSLIIVDKFGNPTREEVHPFDHIECRMCGQKYTMKWMNGGDGRKHPYVADPSIARQFTNYFVKKINKIIGR